MAMAELNTTLILNGWADHMLLLAVFSWFSFFISLGFLALLVVPELPGRSIPTSYGLESLKNDIEPDCQYWYSFVPPSEHGLDEWGQSIALAVTLVGVVVRLIYGIEKTAYVSFDLIRANLASKFTNLRLFGS